MIQFDCQILKYETGEGENEVKFLGKAIENLENTLSSTYAYILGSSATKGEINYLLHQSHEHRTKEVIEFIGKNGGTNQFISRR